MSLIVNYVSEYRSPPLPSWSGWKRSERLCTRIQYVYDEIWRNGILFHDGPKFGTSNDVGNRGLTSGINHPLDGCVQWTLSVMPLQSERPGYPGKCKTAVKVTDRTHCVELPVIFRNPKCSAMYLFVLTLNTTCGRIYSLFTLRKAHFPLRITGEQGFLSMNKL